MYKSKQFARIEEKLDRILVALNVLPPEIPVMPPVEPPQPPPAPEPIPGYDKLNVAETLEALSDFKDDKEFIAATLEYERTHKNRATVVEQLVNWNSGTS